jgi:hypothetical protein
MANFLTQAGSDVWDIIRKKLPESFGLEWGISAVPEGAKPAGLAKAALNAYGNLPTASNEDISRQIQGRVALSGLIPSPSEKPPSPMAPSSSTVIPAASPRLSPEQGATPKIEEPPSNPTFDRGAALAKEMLNSRPAFQPANATISTFPVETKEPERSPIATTREALISRIMEMIGNPHYTVGAVEGAAHALNALTGAEAGDQNARIARQKLAFPLPISGFQGNEHAVDLFYPETGQRSEFFRGALPRENKEGSLVDSEGKDLRKLMHDLITKEFESDLKTAMDPLATPDDKKAAQERVAARKSLFGGGQAGAARPTWEQFLETAQKAGSRMSESQLKQAYLERYGQ